MLAPSHFAITQRHGPISLPGHMLLHPAVLAPRAQGRCMLPHQLQGEHWLQHKQMCRAGAFSVSQCLCASRAGGPLGPIAGHAATHTTHNRTRGYSLVAAARGRGTSNADSAAGTKPQAATQQPLVDSDELSAELEAAVTTAVAPLQPSQQGSQQLRELVAARRAHAVEQGAAVPLATPTPPSTPPNEQRPEWMATHMTVWHLLGSGALSACMLVGAFFWARYAVTQVGRKGARSDGNSSATAASSQAPEDKLGDPWAPIRYIFSGGRDGSSSSSSRSAGAEAGSSSMVSSSPERPTTAASSAPEPAAPAVPQLPVGWWRSLDRVYYTNFGAKLGILPRVSGTDAELAAAVTGASTSGELLVVFEDKVDAEFAAAALHADLSRAAEATAATEALAAAVHGAAGVTAAGSSGSSSGSATGRGAGRRSGAAGAPPRPSVVSGSPMYLEAVARAQGAELAVVPRDVLPAYFSTQLDQGSMASLLSDILKGKTPTLIPIPPPVPARPAAATAAPATSSVTGSLPSDGMPLVGRMADGGTATAPSALSDLEKLAGVRLPTAFDFPGFDAPPSPAASTSAPGVPSVPGASLPPTSSDSPAAGAPASSNTAAAPGTQRAASRPTSSETAITAEAVPQTAAAKSPASRSPSTTQASKPTPPATPPVPESHQEPELVTPSLVIEPPPVAPSARWEAATLSRPPAPSQPASQAPDEAPAQLGLEAAALGSEQLGGAAGAQDAEDDVLREYEAFKQAFTGGAPSGVPVEEESEQSDVDPNAVAAVLRKSGPTDAALQEAGALLGVPSTVGGDPKLVDDLIKEWYSLQQDSTTEDEAPAPVQQPTGVTGARGAVAAAAAKQGAPTATAAGSASNSASQLDALRSQLEVLESQITELTGSSSSSELQQRASQLRMALDAVAPGSSSTSSSGAGSSSSAGQTRVPAGGSVGGSSSRNGNNGTAGGSTAGSAAADTAGSAGSSGKRAWGAWGSNRRVQQAGVTLIKPSDSHSSGSDPSSSSNSSGSRSNSTSTPAQPANSAAPQQPAASAASKPATGPSTTPEQRQSEEDDGAVIVSRRAGKERPWKKTRDAAERQATVKEAMRYVSSGLGGAVEPDTERVGGEEVVVDRATGIDWAAAGRCGAQEGPGHGTAGASSSGQGGKEKWWSRRFEVLYLPTIKYSDGSVGYVQIDVSLQPERRDVRVVTFEDRHDAMHCLTIMKQWPEYEWHQLEMCALPANKIEGEVVRAWETSQDESGRRPTRPTGVVVFRRGKLPMRVGMSTEQFTQLVVYQAAAQVSLSRVGYDFDDF